jgi:hypothetical protein
VVDHTFVGDFLLGICANAHAAHRIDEWFFFPCLHRIARPGLAMGIVMMLVRMMLGVSSTHESLLGQIRLFLCLRWNQLW